MHSATVSVFMYATHSANSVVAADKVGVGYGSITSLYGPHRLTEK